MNQSEKLLSEMSLKIDFILKLHSDFENFAQSQMKSLAKLLEKHSSRKDSEINVADCVENIQQLLNQNLEDIQSNLREGVQALTHHRSMAESIQKIGQGPRKEELTQLFLAEAGAVEELEVFKTRVLKEELERRKAFKAFVDEIEETIQEGGIIELEAFLEHELIKQSAEKFADEEDETEPDLEQHEIAKFLKQLTEPYTITHPNPTAEEEADS
jgi:hypothetical protein